MPLPKGTKYRYKKGTDIRLAFAPGGKVIETKNMKSGATHSPAEFQTDRAKKKTSKRYVGGADALLD